MKLEYQPLPEVAWKVREATRLRERFETETYEAEGALWWVSSKRPVPVSCFKDGFVVPPVKQKEIEDRETSAFLASYRESQKNRVLSNEEKFEMRAAFGPGVEVVNVITGRKFRT